MKVATTILALLGGSEAVSLDARSVATLENYLDESVGSLNLSLAQQMTKTYPIKDARSWIEPYKVEAHAWSDKQEDLTNNDQYCANAPSGYTLDLKCGGVAKEEDEVNKNLTAVQKKFIEEMTKGMSNRTWQHSKSIHETGKEIKFVSTKTAKNWTEVGSEEQKGTWDLIMNMGNQTILKYVKGSTTGNFKLESNEGMVVFKAVDEVPANEFGGTVIISKEKKEDDRTMVELRALLDTGATWSQSSSWGENWLSPWLWSKSGFKESANNNRAQAYSTDVMLKEPMVVRKLLYKKANGDANHFLKSFQIIYKDSSSKNADKWMQYKGKKMIDMDVVKEDAQDKVHEYKMNPPFKADQVRIYWYSPDVRSGRFDLAVSADAAKYGKIEGVIANKAKYLVNVTGSSFRAKPTGRWNSDDIGLNAEYGFHADHKDKNYYIDFNMTKSVKVKYAVIKKRGTGNPASKKQGIETLSFEYKKKGDEKTWTKVENGKKYNTNFTSDTSFEADKKIDLPDFEAKLVRVYMSSKQTRSGRIELFVAADSDASAGVDKKGSLIQRGLNANELNFIGNYAVGKHPYRFLPNHTFFAEKPAGRGAWDLAEDKDGTYLRLVWSDLKHTGENEGSAFYNLTSSVAPAKFKCMNSTYAGFMGKMLIKKSNLTDAERAGENLENFFAKVHESHKKQKRSVMEQEIHVPVVDQNELKNIINSQKYGVIRKQGHTGQVQQVAPRHHKQHKHAAKKHHAHHRHHNDDDN